MSKNNVLITGTPRSGTTLTCHLLNELPDTVALHEPMKVREFVGLQNHEEICRTIERFCAEQRMSIHSRGLAISKNVDGAVPDNPYGADRSDTRLRQSIASKGEIVIDKKLSEDFMLVVKHNASFTAMLEGLVKHFPVYAVVRNPLATLASWSTIDFNAQSGYAPAAEQLDPSLKTKLAAIDGRLDRQIYLLGWFHGQFLRYLPEQSIIRYESVVESGGRALSVVRPEAKDLSEPLESRNKSKLYNYEDMLRIGERLLKSEGAYWELYTRESVERLLEELGVIQTESRPPISLSKPGVEPDVGNRHEENQVENSKTVRRRVREQRQTLRTKRQELSQIKSQLDATKGQAERAKYRALIKEKRLEIRRLREAIHAARVATDADTPEEGRA